MEVTFYYFEMLLKLLRKKKYADKMLTIPLVCICV